MKKALCIVCERVTPHRHLHDEAHGIAGTHIDGSERFVCTICKHTTFQEEPGSKGFSFILDKPVNQDPPPLAA